MELLHNPEFWVLVGFLIFFILLGRTLWKVMRDGLDGRAAKIQEQLNEAAQLRAEAESLLNLYRSKQEQAVRDAEDILAQAKAEAELMRQNAEADLKRSLAAREAQAKDRIALAEQAAIQQVKARAVDIAVRAATSSSPLAMPSTRLASSASRSIIESDSLTFTESISRRLAARMASQSRRIAAAAASSALFFASVEASAICPAAARARRPIAAITDSIVSPPLRSVCDRATMGWDLGVAGVGWQGVGRQQLTAKGRPKPPLRLVDDRRLRHQAALGRQATLAR